MKNNILEKLDIMIPKPTCELIYNKDYELLIATILSAQSTDKRVNEVTKELFSKYNIFTLAKANVKNVESIIKSVGTYHRKSIYIIEVAKKLVSDFNGKVPNDRKYIESLSGSGRKTCNVVLANLFNVPTIAVDTHVMRVSEKLGFTKKTDNVLMIEKKLCKKIPKEKWNKVNNQLILFGRYICKSKKPICQDCLFNNDCK